VTSENPGCFSRQVAGLSLMSLMSLLLFASSSCAWFNRRLLTSSPTPGLGRDALLRGLPLLSYRSLEACETQAVDKTGLDNRSCSMRMERHARKTGSCSGAPDTRPRDLHAFLQAADRVAPPRLASHEICGRGWGAAVSVVHCHFQKPSSLGCASGR
jgi:hypothetical protein